MSDKEALRLGLIVMMSALDTSYRKYLASYQGANDGYDRPMNRREFFEEVQRIIARNA